MIFNVTSGGSTTMNFRVVGGTTAPANPAENCIWVNTDTPITSWLFSAEEPSPAEAGMVWISVGTSSPVAFNALKKNGIQVYPLSAKQYVSGAWVDVTAMSYQGGEWLDFTVYLFNNGDQCVAVTGGWVAYNGTGSTATIGDTLSIAVTGSSARVATAATANTTYLEAGSELEFTLNVSTFTSGNSEVHVGIATEVKAYTTFVAEANPTATGDFVLTVPVTESGFYYVAIRADMADVSCSVIIKK